MRKTIDIEGTPVELNSSAGWLYIYRTEFGRDILPDIMPMIEGLLTVLIEFMKQSDDGEITADALISFADDNVISDLAATLSGLETTTILNIFWAMAKNADKTIPAPFEFFSELECVALDVMLPEMFELVIKSSVSSKNSMSLLEKFKGMSLTKNLSL